MEAWEKDLREKLEGEIPNGVYIIDGSGGKAMTGKMGLIEFEVAVQREFRKNGKVKEETPDGI
jgi:hypothetical protein